MDSSVSPKDEIWFLRVCHHISTQSTAVKNMYTNTFTLPVYLWRKETKGQDKRYVCSVPISNVHGRVMLRTQHARNVSSWRQCVALHCLPENTLEEQRPLPLLCFVVMVACCIRCYETSTIHKNLYKAEQIIHDLLSTFLLVACRGIIKNNPITCADHDDGAVAYFRLSV